MPRFIVTTFESVKGTYAVEAESEDEARARFDDPQIMWGDDDVEQIDYIAFSLDVEEVELSA